MPRRSGAEPRSVCPLGAIGRICVAGLNSAAGLKFVLPVRHNRVPGIDAAGHHGGIALGQRNRNVAGFTVLSGFTA